MKFPELMYSRMVACGRDASEGAQYPCVASVRQKLDVVRPL